MTFEYIFGLGTDLCLEQGSLAFSDFHNGAVLTTSGTGDRQGEDGTS